MSYVELVKGLRENAERCDYDGWIDTAIWFEKAADAIEELQGQIDGWIEQERKALLKSVPKWVSMTEQLPEDLQTVLVVRKDGGIYCWMYSACSPTDEVWVDEYANAFSIYDTTHWMPLPEPPKEETE